ncbi:phosphoglycerate kinase [Candidatus Nomurabacteria bacterium RIFCSPHIGHO2_02_FULL_37_13]|uniref:Phosphoglycerate kinase n=1 Tax=Candidatus Nomurabacteria bacterium RIFCSPHIGHO2_02_FULL_37_13 TaxID=1801750 RepID=A0A1F6W7F9_9BACT|nr:MAG: phosphoglycerate kinase [Candidatus Nomurabacteria bacterium RIFCSPHIGHO2_01_FULL_36_23]OGI77732.1 MAG: phosphoglycerate kinase [Candidatus Nomurabacteria bacterium RIFCSPHIGHO2_02_FULL_37_13]OGI87851.1 MAG: phosphoglycerate kinase [Candidatus Nomurabacteria bacterium RIFCSPLOWO2_01_FULL_37_25]
MRGIKQIKNIRGRKILIRVDFNLPIKNGKVEDDFRIKKALPTINFLQKKAAKIILITHLGKGGDTLAPVAEVLNKFIKIKFVPDIIGEKTQKAVRNMKNGEIILLENLRNNAGEKECSKIFAVNLAKLGDIYVNEAFPVSHREDASIILLPKLLPSYAGLQLEKEVKNLSHAFNKPKHPFLFILGGAKFSTKIPLIKKYLKLADHVFIGGALANDFLKSKGYEVGQSLVSDTNYGISKIIKNKKLILPDYVVVKSGDKLINKKANEVKKDEIILDNGSQAVGKLASLIKTAKLILWNGPLGKYEVGGARSTKEVLKLVALSKAESIIGGGDTVTMISEMNMEHKFSFVSTGGGAILDFLANGTLPGITALK